MKAIDRIAGYLSTNLTLTGKQNRRIKHKKNRAAARLPKGIRVEYLSGRSRTIEIPPKAPKDWAQLRIEQLSGNPKIKDISVITLGS